MPITSLTTCTVHSCFPTDVHEPSTTQWHGIGTVVASNTGRHLLADPAEVGARLFCPSQTTSEVYTVEPGMVLAHASPLSPHVSAVKGSCCDGHTIYSTLWSWKAAQFVTAQSNP